MFRQIATSSLICHKINNIKVEIKLFLLEATVKTLMCYWIYIVYKYICVPTYTQGNRSFFLYIISYDGGDIFKATYLIRNFNHTQIKTSVDIHRLAKVSMTGLAVLDPQTDHWPIKVWPIIAVRAAWISFGLDRHWTLENM